VEERERSDAHNGNINIGQSSSARARNRAEERKDELGQFSVESRELGSFPRFTRMRLEFPEETESLSFKRYTKLLRDDLLKPRPSNVSSALDFPSRRSEKKISPHFEARFQVPVDPVERRFIR